MGWKWQTTYWERKLSDSTAGYGKPYVRVVWEG